MAFPLRRTALAAGALAALGAVIPAPASAAPTGCTATETERTTSSAHGLFRARLAGDGRSDWDLTVRDAGTGRIVAASSHFGSRELAEGFVAAGRPLVVKACRRSGRGPSGGIRTAMTPIAKAAQAPKLVRVHLANDAEMDLLQTLDLDLSEHARDTYIDVVIHDDVDMGVLRRSGLRHTVLLEDMVAADRQAAAAAGPPDGPMPSGRVSYRRLADFSGDMKKLAAENPTLVKPITLPHPSLEGRPIEGIEITENVTARDGKPVFLMTGIHHAREWPSAEMTMEWAFELVNTFKAGKERTVGLLKKARVIVVPIMNPDGFNLSRESTVEAGQSIVDPGFAYKRRNCRVKDFAIPAPGECGQSANRGKGVDPNRNYGGFWGGPGASGNTGSDTYRGPAPFSEPEVQNVREIISSRAVTTFITNHTYSDLVLRPPGLEAGPTPPDEAIYKELGDAMAAENGYESQKSFELYDTTGTAEDWSYYITGGLGFTFEIGNGDKIPGVGAFTGAGFHPPYPTVVAEWFGKYPTGGGNREAYYLALESTANAERHSVVEGRGPAGATVTLRKTVTSRTMTSGTPDSPPVTYTDKLVTSMEIPAGGGFELHANPSTRPAMVLEGQTEAWELVCESASGAVLGRTEVVVARGERKSVGEVCTGQADGGAAAPGAPATALKVKAGKLRRGVLPVRVSCATACDVAAVVRAGKRTVGKARRKGVSTSTLKIRVRAPREARRLVLLVTARTAGAPKTTVRRTVRVRR